MHSIFGPKVFGAYTANKCSIGASLKCSMTKSMLNSTRPISVTPPAGWTDSISHADTGDGYAIEFLATDPNAYVKPGATANFRFPSADTPASIAGNSQFFPTTPVGTSVLYPTTPFNNGVTIEVTPAPPPAPPPPPPPPPAPGAALVTLGCAQK